MTYLVMVDVPGEGPFGPPIAGIYVNAASKAEAVKEVRALLAGSRLTAYRREEAPDASR